MEDDQARALLALLAEYARHYGDETEKGMKVSELAGDLMESMATPVPRGMGSYTVRMQASYDADCNVIAQVF